MVCCICKKNFDGYGNNPAPIKYDGRCCDECNRLVIQRRLSVYEKTKAQVYAILKPLIEEVNDE